MTDVPVPLLRPHESVVAPPNNVPYVIAVIAMSIACVAAIVAITFARPEADNSVLITTVIGFATTTTASLLAFMKSQETHLSVNSRLDAFMRNAELAAHVQGIVEGRSQGRDMADARTDALAGGVHDPARDVVVVENQPGSNPPPGTATFTGTLKQS
jgi:hypothetical protein